MIPHRMIRASMDRTWVSRLIDALVADTDTGERDESVDSLIEIGDPRVRVPLTGVVEDPARPDDVRAAAMEVLVALALTPDAPGRTRWWESGDPLLQDWALREADLAEGDRLQRVLADPGSPLFAAALAGIGHGFDTRFFQHYKIDALRHDDALIRAQAADELVWDEPVAAESELLKATDDPDTGVVISAVQTLAFYHSRESFARIAHLAVRGRDETLAAEAARALETLAETFAANRADVAGVPRARERLDEWLAPVAGMLADLSQDEVTGVGMALAEDQPVPMLDQVLAALSDLDSAWATKLDLLSPDDYDWNALGDGDRARAAEYLIAHPDRDVRVAACRLFAGWGRTDALIGLAVDDEDFHVRKAAMWALSAVPDDARSQAAADAAWRAVKHGGYSGTRAQEALEAFARHAMRPAAQQRLLELARTDERESVRQRAIALLADAADLGPLLDEEPAVSWAVHYALLVHEHPPRLSLTQWRRLTAVDNLDIAVGLAVNAGRVGAPAGV